MNDQMHITSLQAAFNARPVSQYFEPRDNDARTRSPMR